MHTPFDVRVEAHETMAAATQGSFAASCGAIVAGSAVALAASLMLLTLGAGIKFASISPSAEETSGIAVTVISALWFILTQLIATCLGGYVARRLRVRWTGASFQEEFFRDTAHGFLAWPLASAAMTLLAATAVVSLVKGGTHDTVEIASGIASTGLAGEPSFAYDIAKTGPRRASLTGLGVRPVDSRGDSRAKF